ncbi:MAG: glucose 1-dehydrogenase [Tissierellia bacterium]|jgi:NAD(P)-dependent dehydrogenase (short-subunit alcohol dehydrogenase family)|nr:glucose 1-dehydrogenase [Tissierellia bacterium]
MRLENKVAIVTGASSGIGKAVAALFAKEGAKVVAAARRSERLEDLQKEIADGGFSGEIYPVSADVGKDEDLKHLVDATLEKYGTIDILINNAGILDEYKSLENVEEDLWMKVFDINVHAVMKLSKLVLPTMLGNKKGSIVNTASVGGLHGMRGGLAYVASKHAVIGMTKNIAYTYADDGIRCNAVAPGSVGTEIGESVKNPDMKSLDKLMKGVEIFPTFGKPEELAYAFLYLASDEASFTNGHALVVDGGWTAY